jgi:TPR repeat protein
MVNVGRERSDSKDNEAMLWLALMYREGKGVRKNIHKALE